MGTEGDHKGISKLNAQHPITERLEIQFKFNKTYIQHKSRLLS